MADVKKLLERAASATRESKYLDFKREFDLSPEAWCEIIKDIVAFANSGGGIIIFGVANDGTNTDFDAAELLAHDPSDISNRIARYTGIQAVDFEIIELKRGNTFRTAFVVSETDVPIIFAKPGTYDIGGGKQKTAFSQGTIYFRHGSKSEPGNRDDLSRWRDREIARARKSWLGGIRKVVETAPADAITVVSASKSGQKSAAIINAKVSDDPSAVRFVPENAEEIWPHRQMDLIRAVNRQIGNEQRINTHDIYCIKMVFDILRKHREFADKSHRLASPQYSNEFVDWIVDQYRRDKAFFQRVRAEYRRKTR
jgi:Putative DNA-binding domain